MLFKNRVTEMLGVEIPVVQAPMGWIARSQLASAVSNAGGLGIIETSSGELDAIREEIKKMRQLTDKPFGVNIAQAFVRDPGIAQFIIDQGVKFVTTSAGSPERYTEQLKARGADGIPRGAEPVGRVEGGRMRRGRVDRRGRRGRRFQESERRRDDGAAAAGAIEGDGADHRGRRLRRRRQYGRGIRARRGRRATRHADGVVEGIAGARQLEERDRQRERDRHRVPQPVPFAGAARVAHRTNDATREEPAK